MLLHLWLPDCHALFHTLFQYHIIESLFIPWEVPNYKRIQWIQGRCTLLLCMDTCLYVSMYVCMHAFMYVLIFNCIYMHLHNHADNTKMQFKALQQPHNFLKLVVRKLEPLLISVKSIHVCLCCSKRTSTSVEAGRIPKNIYFWCILVVGAMLAPTDFFRVLSSHSYNW